MPLGPDPFNDHQCPAFFAGLLPGVQTRHWYQFAQASGLSKAQTKKRVLRMAQDLPVSARQLQASPPFSNQLIVGLIIALTARRLIEGNDEINEQDIDGQFES